MWVTKFLRRRPRYHLREVAGEVAAAWANNEGIARSRPSGGLFEVLVEWDRTPEVIKRLRGWTRIQCNGRCIASFDVDADCTSPASLGLAHVEQNLLTSRSL